MKVNERFLSVQGEGLDAGRLTAFVRFTACNLRCGYCDTEYAFYEGAEIPLEDVVAWVVGTGAPVACLTGGEPLLQADLPILASRLLEEGLEVVVETGGSLSIAALPEGVVRVVDIKTPGALRKEGEDPATFAASRRFRRMHLHTPNLDLLGPLDQVKFVLVDRFDYEWALALLEEHGLCDRAGAILLSPVHPGLDPAELVAWMAADRPKARLNLQLHKYIWGAEARGV